MNKYILNISSFLLEIQLGRSKRGFCYSKNNVFILTWLTPMNNEYVFLFYNYDDQRYLKYSTYIIF